MYTTHLANEAVNGVEYYIISQYNIKKECNFMTLLYLKGERSDNKEISMIPSTSFVCSTYCGGIKS